MAFSSASRQEIQVCGLASSLCGVVSSLSQSPLQSHGTDVGQGPYKSAVLKFQISFPDAYPRLPPLVTFATDMFHPLITPLTTYMYSTDVQGNGTVSATDDERLPPGGFSLRHGFPIWFGRRTRNAAAHLQPAQTPPRQTAASTGSLTPSSKGSAVGESPGFAETKRSETSTFEVLRYIRSTFDDEDVLDSIPIEAAGNPGAWHAWRTHRQDNGKVFTSTTEDGSDPASSQAPTLDIPAKKPGEWNWEGVWEERVKKGISASLSESVLFGGAGGADDVVRRSIATSNMLINMLTQRRFDF